MGEADPPVLVISNRGPVSFSFGDDGGLVAKRGGGGLVSSLGPLVRDIGATWMAAAATDADRQAAAEGVIDAEGFKFRSLAVDPDAYQMAYDVVSNATLWFLHHGLFDLTRRPRLDRRWREAWDAYRDVNHAFARAVIDEAPEGSIVLVQDYHLALVGTWLAQERRDLRAVHFSHIPFCEPGALRVLPSDVAEELLVGMGSHASCGFHARRWAANFEACCQETLGFTPATFVSPLSPHYDDIAALASSDDCKREQGWVDEVKGDRQLIVRVDRIEPSKNILRGFWAFDDLLRARSEWRGRVVFVACVYPSREGLPEYLAYRQEVESVAAVINDRWATPGWTPILLDTSDNFPRSIAALTRYDVLLVNPVRDGLNLVAKEGAVLNECNGVLALSREAGAWEELGGVALEVNPFDVSGTADVLATALTMAPGERATHAEALAKAASARVPRDWFEDMLKVAGAATGLPDPPATKRAAP
ncbi:MAG TPA: trehalose-6-phosphate synthase [Acidimicrobiales bacterium]|jgi:trehalose 6-phosphate synthase|nr:trehalose-6-phosphate synthase [Acidimicrobiales bacterium]